MSWGNDQIDKIKEFCALVLTILLDSLFVLIVALLTEWLKLIIENYIIHAKLESPGHQELKIVYTYSQILVISVSTIYMLTDIIRHIIKAWKELRK